MLHVDTDSDITPYNSRETAEIKGDAPSDIICIFVYIFETSV